MIDLKLTNEELNALREYLDEDYKAINQMLITDEIGRASCRERV